MSQFREEVQPIIRGLCSGVDCSLTIHKLMQEMPGNKMEKIENKGDGHCYYHTCLRFIYENRDYFNTIDIVLDGQNKKVSDLIPEGYQGFRGASFQNASDIYLLRKALIQSNLKDFIFDKDNGAYKSNGKNVYLKGMIQAENNSGAGPEEWAGEAGPREFIDMALMLKTCILIWQENEFDRGKWLWKFFPSADVAVDPDYMRDCEGKVRDEDERIIGDDREINLLNNHCCPIIMFAINTGGVHFDGLLPKRDGIQSGDIGGIHVDSLISEKDELQIGDTVIIYGFKNQHKIYNKLEATILKIEPDGKSPYIVKTIKKIDGKQKKFQLGKINIKINSKAKEKGIFRNELLKEYPDVDEKTRNWLVEDVFDEDKHIDKGLVREILRDDPSWRQYQQDNEREGRKEIKLFGRRAGSKRKNTKKNKRINKKTRRGNK